MRQFLRKIKTAWRLSFIEKIWLLFFFPYSGLIRLAILTLPYKLLSRTYGTYLGAQQLSTLVTEQQRLRAWRIGKMAELVARYTPWESKCLVQALMVRTLLSIYDIPFALFLGAYLTHDPAEPMKAHAWVKVGAWVVSGRKGHRAYAVTACFVSPTLINVPAQKSHSTL